MPSELRCAAWVNSLRNIRSCVLASCCKDSRLLERLNRPPQTLRVPFRCHLFAMKAAQREQEAASVRNRHDRLKDCFRLDAEEVERKMVNLDIYQTSTLDGPVLRNSEIRKLMDLFDQTNLVAAPSRAEETAAGPPVALCPPRATGDGEPENRFDDDPMAGAGTSLYVAVPNLSGCFLCSWCLYTLIKCYACQVVRESLPSFMNYVGLAQKVHDDTGFSFLNFFSIPAGSRACRNHLFMLSRRTNEPLLENSKGQTRGTLSMGT